MGPVLLILGMVIFFAAHVFTTMRGRRAALIARIGEGSYKGLYSLVSLAGLVMIAYGFGIWRAAGSAQLWYPPVWTKHIALVLVPIAAILIVAAYVPSHLRTRMKHPMLTAVKLWALAHLLANGDLAGVVLFGGFLIYAVYDRIAVKERAAPIPPAPAGYGGDVMAVVGGLALFLVLGYVFHPYVVGVPVIPG
ncbi:MAG TPA: NnrU family protein [Xanthobacteraceae bacterium]|nr:NnrU family protein [Xanthobacteraceae bacterium]